MEDTQTTKPSSLVPVIIAIIITFIVASVIATTATYAVMTYLILPKILTSQLTKIASGDFNLPVNFPEPQDLPIPSFPDSEETPIQSEQACEVTDTSLCSVIATIKQAIAVKTFNSVIAMQSLQSVTCDPDGMAIAICEGEAKGVVKQGYLMGYNQSEGAIVNKDHYLDTLISYVSENSPLTYKGAVSSGDKAMMAYISADGDNLLAFPFRKTNGSWKLLYALYGIATDDFKNFSPAILNNYFQ